MIEFCENKHRKLEAKGTTDIEVTNREAQTQKRKWVAHTYQLRE